MTLPTSATPAARKTAAVLYGMSMVAVVVGVDLPVLQKPVLGTADGERGNRPGVRGVLLEVPEASMSGASARSMSADCVYCMAQ